MKKALSLIVCLMLVGALFASCTPQQTDPTYRDMFDNYGLVDKGEKEHVRIVPNTVKIYREDVVEKNGLGVLTVSLGKNEYEAVQFVLCFDEDSENVRVTCRDVINEKGEQLEATVYRQYYYYYDETAAVEKKGWIPDTLIPMFDGSDGQPANDTCTVEAGMNQGYWISMYAAVDQTPGEYRGLVDVTYGDGQTVTIPLVAEVWGITVPVTPTMETVYLSAWSNGYYEDQGISSRDFNRMIWEMGLKYRFCGTQPYFTTRDSWTADIENYVLEIKDFVDTHPGVTTLMFPLFSFDVWDYNLDDPDSPLPTKIVEDVHNINLYNALVKYGLADISYWAPLDEPSYGRKNIYALDGISRQIDEYFPEMRMFCTLSQDMAYQHGSKFSALDCWVPIITGFDEAWAREKIAEGKTVWWYNCITPDIPYPTYRQNDCLIAPRLLHWMQRDKGVQGELFWSTTLYQKLKDGSYSENYDIWHTLENVEDVYGDGVLFMPGKIGDGIVGRNMLVPTLRVEAIRDGMEDYEYLTILENKWQGIIEKLGLSVTSDDLMNTYYAPLYAAMDNYSHDSQLLLTMRSIVAEDILKKSDTIVRVTDTEDGSRAVEVYAASGLSVGADGLSFIETVKDGYSVYTATAENQIDDAVTVTVGAETFRRIIAKY